MSAILRRYKELRLHRQYTLLFDARRSASLQSLALDSVMVLRYTSPDYMSKYDKLKSQVNTDITSSAMLRVCQ